MFKAHTLVILIAFFKKEQLERQLPQLNANASYILLRKDNYLNFLVGFTTLSVK